MRNVSLLVVYTGGRAPGIYCCHTVGVALNQSQIPYQIPTTQKYTLPSSVGMTDQKSQFSHPCATRFFDHQAIPLYSPNVQKRRGACVMFGPYDRPKCVI